MKLRITLVLTIQVLALASLASSLAYANPPNWKWNGVFLDDMEEKANVDLTGNVADTIVLSGNTVTYTCALAEKWNVIGGSPGTGEITSGTYTSCTVTSPAACQIEKLEGKKYNWPITLSKTGAQYFITVENMEWKLDFRTVAGCPGSLNGKKYRLRVPRRSGRWVNGLSLQVESTDKDTVENEETSETEEETEEDTEELTAGGATLEVGEEGEVMSSGPYWKREGAELALNEWQQFTAHQKGNFSLKSSNIAIICKKMLDAGRLIGGTPGQDEGTITLSECEVEGHSECHVNSPGQSSGTIASKAKTELVYLGSKVEAEHEEGRLGDIFRPHSGETLIELDITGSGCPPFTKGEQEIKGSVIGEVEPVNTIAKEGKQVFPTTAIKQAYEWESAGKVKEIAAGLKIFSIIAVTESGEAAVELEGKEEFGAFA
jgi:hypothetical protein